LVLRLNHSHLLPPLPTSPFPEDLDSIAPITNIDIYTDGSFHSSPLSSMAGFYSPHTTPDTVIIRTLPLHSTLAELTAILLALTMVRVPFLRNPANPTLNIYTDSLSAI